MSSAQAQIGGIPVEGSGLLKLAEISLIAGIILSVLAFGGTEPISFAVVEVFLTGVAAFFVLFSRKTFPFPNRLFLAPAMLMGLVLLQLCPFPATWLGGAEGKTWSGSEHFARLTIEPFATREHFLTLLSCIIAFFLAYVVSQDARRKRQIVMAIVALGSFEALYGLVQYLTGWQRIFTYTKKYDLDEATGTYINRNHYAGFLEMVLPFALALALYEFGKRYKGQPETLSKLRRLAARPNLQKFTLWLFMASLLFAALFYSRSRMGMISASTSILVILGILLSKKKAGLPLCASFLVVSISLALWIGPGPIVNRFQGIPEEYAQNSRLSIWRDTVALIRQHPWIGTGFGTFPIAYTAVQTTFLGQFVNHAHNDYLELASDLGIPAGFGLVLSLVWLLARAVRISRIAKDHYDRFLALGCVGGMVAILLHSLADFNLYIPANCLLFASILGLTMGLGTPPVSPASGGR